MPELVKMADQSSSRQLVIEIVRTAYALGKFDAVIEATLAEVNSRRLDRHVRQEVLS